MTKHEYQKLQVIDKLAFPLDNKKSVIHQFIPQIMDLKMIEKQNVPQILFVEVDSNLVASERQHQENQIKYLNVSGLHTLSYLLNKALKKETELLSYISTDEFQLEAKLKQYDIEVNSIFLKNRLGELMTNEKQYEELHRLLAVKFTSLSEIKNSLESLISEHKELIGMYEMVALFCQMLFLHLFTNEQNVFYYLLFEHYMHLKPIIIGSIADAKVKNAITLWKAIKSGITQEGPELHTAYRKYYKAIFGEEPLQPN